MTNKSYDRVHIIICIYEMQEDTDTVLFTRSNVSWCAVSTDVLATRYNTHAAFRYVVSKIFCDKWS
jgi:hypothetical protein